MQKSNDDSEKNGLKVPGDRARLHLFPRVYKNAFAEPDENTGESKIIFSREELQCLYDAWCFHENEKEEKLKAEKAKRAKRARDLNQDDNEQPAPAAPVAEPAAAAPAAPASAKAAPGATDYRARLVAIYERYNPAKLGSVDKALEVYAGREEEMLEALVSKYLAFDVTVALHAGGPTSDDVVAVGEPVAQTEPQAEAEGDDIVVREQSNPVVIDLMSVVDLTEEEEEEKRVMEEEAAMTEIQTKLEALTNKFHDQCVADPQPFSGIGNNFHSLVLLAYLFNMQGDYGNYIAADFLAKGTRKFVKTNVQGLRDRLFAQCLEELDAGPRSRKATEVFTIAPHVPKAKPKKTKTLAAEESSEDDVSEEEDDPQQAEESEEDDAAQDRHAKEARAERRLQRREALQKEALEKAERKRQREEARLIAKREKAEAHAVLQTRTLNQQHHKEQHKRHQETELEVVESRGVARFAKPAPAPHQRLKIRKPVPMEKADPARDKKIRELIISALKVKGGGAPLSMVLLLASTLVERDDRYGDVGTVEKGTIHRLAVQMRDDETLSGYEGGYMIL